MAEALHSVGFDNAFLPDAAAIPETTDAQLSLVKPIELPPYHKAEFSGAFHIFYDCATRGMVRVDELGRRIPIQPVNDGASSEVVE